MQFCFRRQLHPSTSAAFYCKLGIDAGLKVDEAFMAVRQSSPWGLPTYCLFVVGESILSKCRSNSTYEQMNYHTNFKFH